MRTDRLQIAFDVVQERLSGSDVGSRTVWGLCPVCCKSPLELWKPSIYLERHLRSKGYKGDIDICAGCLIGLAQDIPLDIPSAPTRDPPW